LLTNVVMTWNATKIDEVRGREPEEFPDHQLRHIAPNAHGHINTKGVITIDISRYRHRLIPGHSAAAETRSAVQKPR
jgi:hypothetical protein